MLALLRLHLRWQVASCLCLVLSMVAAAGAQVTSSNTSTSLSYIGSLKLQTPDGRNISDLVPLTRGAVRGENGGLGGSLVDTNATTMTTLSAEDVSYISCDARDYTNTANDTAAAILQKAIQEHNLTAVILYSTEDDYCGYNSPHEPLQNVALYSMTNRTISAAVLSDVETMAVSEKYFITIKFLQSTREQSGGPMDDDSRSGQGGVGSQNPLGPSPSTAVAMIILYSITGIITALFLVIIITGAIRAHRHPDRYGPRDVLGRPRQSRARGLGRAILDTLPIVKFGERAGDQSDQTPKPTDVEMGSVDPANTSMDTARPEPRTTEQAETRPDTATERDSGIAPAEPATAGAIPRQSAANEENLGCSICTEDFEKGQDIRVLPCDHKFHPECVDPWLLNVSGTCPLCRVDLRPTSRQNSTATDASLDNEQYQQGRSLDEIDPPQQHETDASRHRRSALGNILSFRSRPNASAEERISALRRLRAERTRDQNNGSGTAQENNAATRRSRRISARLSGVFGIGSRARRNQGLAEAGSSQVQSQAASTDPASTQPASTGALPAQPASPEALPTQPPTAVLATSGADEGREASSPAPIQR